MQLKNHPFKQTCQKDHKIHVELRKRVTNSYDVHPKLVKLRHPKLASLLLVGVELNIANPQFVTVHINLNTGMPTSASVARKKVRLRLKSWWANVKRVWLATQLTNYGGKYSVERMLALDEYIGRTSLWRVLFVIFITPLPMALIVISQESVPLQDPAEGWRVNYGFWIRSAVLEAAFAFATMTHVGILIDGATLSPRQIVTFCTAVAALNTVVDITIAACWTFPVPFLTLTHSFVILLVVLIIFRVVVGRRAFREIAAQQRQLMDYSNLNMLTVVMVVAYPAFQVLFELNTKWEQLTIVLLPVLKLVLKFANVRLLAAKEDFLPQEITFSVNFFDALYLATCMQSVTSIKTVAVIMVADVIETALELRELHKKTSNIRARIATILRGDQDNLLDAVRALCTRIEGSSKAWAHSGIQLRSCIRSYKLSHKSTLLLENLYKWQTAFVETHASPTAIMLPKPNRKWWNALPIRANEVQPITKVISVQAKMQSVKNNSVTENVNLIQESLEVLFTAECLVLAEYVETFIPIFYAGFILVMVHLPSAKYHREMEGLTSENVWSVVNTIFLYGLLELLSLVMLAIIMQRNCGIRSLYHLAFVLETQTSLIQSSLVIWTVVTLSFRVVHFGADFSFQFAWIK